MRSVCSKEVIWEEEEVDRIQQGGKEVRGREGVGGEDGEGVGGGESGRVTQSSISYPAQSSRFS